MKHSERAAWTDLEDGFTSVATTTVVSPAKEGCPIEVAVGGLHQPGERGPAIGAVGLRAEVVDRRQRAGESQPEDRPIKVGTALLSRAVKVSISTLHERLVGRRSVRALLLGTKCVDGSEATVGSDFEARAASIRAHVADDAADLRGAVEISIGSVEQRTERDLAVRAIFQRAKAIKRRKCAGGGKFKDCPATVLQGAVRTRSTLAGCPIEAAVGRLHETSSGSRAVGAVGL